ncbi:aminoacyl-histidine dipeptidase [Alistipes sp.]|uniref:aminoacyl-histidine dipeptidase n=1 Tax=Alistipes sp. TaxID=1872444 RepID=UPI003AB25FA7
MSEIASLEPRLVWEQFDAITRVPRPSKKEEKIREYLVRFAADHGIECHTDKIGNVVMRKPATPGYEQRPKVILQSHMDMVCEKNSGVEFDFSRDAIRTRIEGEWVRAEGTTLGADDGIGMAAALAVLIDPEAEHGPLEALFTVDEETGLTGAFELGEGMLTGKYLINLDSEDEGEIFIGCAGGIDTIATFRYTTEAAPKNYTFFRVDVSDLAGGHSGDDIDKGRVNSNKTVARLLWDGMQSYELRLSYFDGGNLRNAIPREAYAIFGVPTRLRDEFRKRYELFAADLHAEFRLCEPNFRITLNEMPAVDHVIDEKTQFGLVYSLVGVPNGVIAMSMALPGLVETSTNLASVKFVDGAKIVVTSSQRSSVESAKTYVMQMVESVFALAGADVAHSDGYPGWAPDPSSRLLEVSVASYRRLFGREPKVRAIHAGLECGLFLEKYPELEMVSFGPTLRGVHSPDERLEIATVAKFWAHLNDILRTL